MLFVALSHCYVAGWVGVADLGDTITRSCATGSWERLNHAAMAYVLVSMLGQNVIVTPRITYARCQLTPMERVVVLCRQVESWHHHHPLLICACLLCSLDDRNTCCSNSFCCLQGIELRWDKPAVPSMYRHW